MTSRLQINGGSYSPRGRSRIAASAHCSPNACSPYGSYVSTKVFASTTPWCYHCTVLYCVKSCYCHCSAARTQVLLHPAEHWKCHICFVMLRQQKPVQTYSTNCHGCAQTNMSLHACRLSPTVRKVPQELLHHESTSVCHHLRCVHSCS